jgi:3-(3-hydroxy-phenyl)propionate hydroxylase
MDDVLPPVFLVVSAAADAQSGLGEREFGPLRRLGAQRVVLRSPADAASKPTAPDVVTLTAKDDLLADWLAETGAAAAVVRPDRYVYGIARTPAELARLVSDLSRALFP